MEDRFRQQLSRLSFDNDFKEFVIKQQTSVQNKGTLKNVIKLKGNQHLAELKVLALEEQQRNKSKSSKPSNGLLAGTLKKFDEKFSKQEAILKTNINSKLQNLLKRDGVLSNRVKKILNSEEICEEIKKSKKTELTLKTPIIYQIKRDAKEAHQLLLTDLSQRIKSFTDRIEEFCSQELDKVGGTLLFDKGGPLNPEVAKTIVDYHFGEVLENTSSEIFTRKIGQQLIQARMIPMYLMMGVSMFGFGSFSKYRKFMGPILLLIMGIAFYMIYNNKMKEEQEEKEKAYKQIRERSKDKVVRALSDIESQTDKEIKSFLDTYKVNLRQYMQQSIQNLSPDAYHSSNTTAVWKAKNKLQKFERDMEKLLLSI